MALPVNPSPLEVVQKVAELENAVGALSPAPLYDTTGVNTDGGMTQRAVTAMVFGDGTKGVQISPDGTASANGKSNVCLGQNARANKGDFGCVAVGKDTYSHGAATVAIGRSAYANNDINVAIGDGANANGSFAIAMGRNTTVNGSSQTVVLGHGATSDGGLSYGVGLGNNSRVTESGTVSVGDGSANAGYGRRRVVNVGDPVNPQDAATKSYVDALAGGGQCVLLNTYTTSGWEPEVTLESNLLSGCSSMELRIKFPLTPDTMQMRFDEKDSPIYASHKDNFSTASYTEILVTAMECYLDGSFADHPGVCEVNMKKHTYADGSAYWMGEAIFLQVVTDNGVIVKTTTQLLAVTSLTGSMTLHSGFYDPLGTNGVGFPPGTEFAVLGA